MSKLSVLIRALVILAGIAILAIGWSYPVTTCMSGTGIETTCTRDLQATGIAVAVFVLGLGTAFAGSVSLYSHMTNPSS